MIIKNISKFICLGLMGMTLTFAASCSDDDNDNNSSSAIIYNNHSFDKAYTMSEGQAYLRSVNSELFSSSGIDTTELKVFITDCRYFNNTYLSYKGADGNSPIDSITANLTQLLSGDLSGLPATLTRYKHMAGKYTANAPTKTWDLTAKQIGNITLTFPDSKGVSTVAKLSWVTAPDENHNYPGTDEEILPTANKNIISVTDSKGNVVNDTLPNTIQLSIEGGSNNLHFLSNIDLNVDKNQYLGIKAFTTFAGYVFSIEQFTTNSFSRSTTIIEKGNVTLATIGSETKGNNLMNYLVNPTLYPITERKTTKTYNIANKIKVEMTQDKLQLLQKTKALYNSGKQPGSKEFAEGLATAKRESQSIMAYDPVNNAFIGSLNAQAYQDTKNNRWTVIPGITLHNGENCTLLDFDKNGVLPYMFGQLQELISRMSSILGGKVL